MALQTCQKCGREIGQGETSLCAQCGSSGSVGAQSDRCPATDGLYPEPDRKFFRPGPFPRFASWFDHLARDTKPFVFLIVVVAGILMYFIAALLIRKLPWYAVVTVVSVMVAGFLLTKSRKVDTQSTASIRRERFRFDQHSPVRTRILTATLALVSSVLILLVLGYGAGYLFTKREKAQRQVPISKADSPVGNPDHRRQSVKIFQKQLKSRENQPGTREENDAWERDMNAQSVFRRGWLKQKSGDYSGAVEDLTFVLGQYPQHFESYYCRGKARAAMGQHKEAVADFDEAIKLNSGFASAYVERGNSKLQLKDEQGARLDWEEAGKVDDFYSKLRPSRRETTGLLKSQELKQEKANIAEAVETISATLRTQFQSPLTTDMIAMMNALSRAFSRFIKSAHVDQNIIRESEKFEASTRDLEPQRALDKETVQRLRDALRHLADVLNKVDVAEYITWDQLKEWRAQFKAVEADRTLTAFQRQGKLADMNNNVLEKRLKERVKVVEVEPLESGRCRVVYGHCSITNCTICRSGGRGSFTASLGKVGNWNKGDDMTVIFEIVSAGVIANVMGQWGLKASGVDELGTDDILEFNNQKVTAGPLRLRFTNKGYLMTAGQPPHTKYTFDQGTDAVFSQEDFVRMLGGASFSDGASLAFDVDTVNKFLRNFSRHGEIIGSLNGKVLGTADGKATIMVSGNMRCVLQEGGIRVSIEASLKGTMIFDGSRGVTQVSLTGHPVTVTGSMEEGSLWGGAMISIGN